MHIIKEGFLKVIINIRDLRDKTMTYVIKEEFLKVIINIRDLRDKTMNYVY